MDWNTFLISLLTSSGVTVIFNFIIKGGISHFYNRKLENFKTDLSLLVEKKKLDFQRKIHDFSLYSNKRHEIYPEIYKNTLKAKNELEIFLGLLLTYENTPRINQNEKKNTFYHIQKLSNQTANAYDHFLYSELFLSDEVSKIGEEIFKDLNEMGSYISSTYFINEEKDNPYKFISYSDLRKKNDNVLLKINDFRTKMKDELNIGDYQP